MTTRANIEDAVVTWVAAATGEEVIIAEQGAPRPAVPYLTIKVSGPVSIGREDRRGITDPGKPDPATQTYRGSREVSVSVQAFGSGAMDLARSAARALFTETARSQLGAAGLCPRGTVPTVNELTELLETDFEERAQFDATLAFGDEYTEDLYLIERVQGSGTFEGSDATIDFDVQKP